MRKADAVVGARADLWTIVAVDGRAVTCVCECGTTRVVDRCNLGRASRSCGCLSLELKRSRVARTTHGHTSRGVSPEYFVWLGMIARCTNQRAPNYRLYGGRGISVCERWLSFEKFFADMGVRPKGTTLDRIDNAHGYEPGNCRWATAKEQAANRSTSRLVTIGGVTKCATEWARAAGVSDNCIFHRLHRGLTGDALIAPPRRGPNLNCPGRTK